MGVKLRPTVLPLLAVLLSGCVNDGASLQIDGKEHSLSLIREQKWLWEDNVDLFVVASRMPDCQRRHRMRSAPLDDVVVEVYSPDAVTFYLRQGGRTYSIETATCEGFRELSDAPANLGGKIGTFRESRGGFQFQEEVKSTKS